MVEGRTGAGALLKAAREKQGLHIAALAAAIKVPPKKLEALENDRFDQLPDAAFTRALAQTVCRTLKIDPQPVLALLPQADPAALDHVAGTLNTPFRERANRGDPVGLAAAAVRPMVAGGVLLVVAAIAIYLLPADFWQRAPALPDVAVAPAASTPAAPAPVVVAASTPEPAASSPVVETVFSAPPIDPAASSAEPPKLVQLRADDASWVEARDGRGQVLFSRVIQPGESVGFDGALPIRLTIGNAGATKLAFRGETVDLALKTRENVARLELQ